MRLALRLSSLAIFSPHIRTSTIISSPSHHPSMESLSVGLSSSSLLVPNKRKLKTPTNLPRIPVSFSSYIHGIRVSILENSVACKTPLKPHPSLPIMLGFLPPYSLTLPSFASEIAENSGELSGKIDIESVLIAIDDFFNKNPFFVSGVTFIWLIVIPLVEEYLKKYKYISAINAFQKLQDDPSAQLLDIRDEKSLAYLGSPSLRLLNKNVAQIPFSEGDEDGFLKKVREKFGDSKQTVVCILDNFDGNSIKVAELLFKNGFKEAYAIRGGVRGKKGWQEIQEELLPPSVHVYPRKKKNKSQKLNSVSNQPDADQAQPAASEK